MKRITILTGHYGTGKTNLSVNLALRAAETGNRVTVIDLDLVNPYFRTADFQALFESNGIRLLAPTYANTNLDNPAFNFDLEGVLSEGGSVILDVGGDDAGASALGRFAGLLSAHWEETEMLYVINRCRALTSTPEETLCCMREIESAARLQHTAVVNNTNLGCETTADLILSSIPFAEAVAEQAGLPLAFTTYERRFALTGSGMLPVEVYVKPIWETNLPRKGEASYGKNDCFV